MGINWKVRIKNKAFWLTMIPAVLVAVQAIAQPLGFTIDVDGAQAALIAAVNAVFVILTLLGVSVDMTTAGIGDSAQAMEYDEPKED